MSGEQRIDEINQIVLREARRAVANSKLCEFRKQCWHLAHLVRIGTIDRTIVIDTLWEIAVGHALVRALGEDRIQSIISEAFANTTFRPMISEIAA